MRKYLVLVLYEVFSSLLATVNGSLSSGKFQCEALLKIFVGNYSSDRESDVCSRFVKKLKFNLRTLNLYILFNYVCQKISLLTGHTVLRPRLNDTELSLLFFFPNEGRIIRKVMLEGGGGEGGGKITKKKYARAGD